MRNQSFISCGGGTFWGAGEKTPKAWHIIGRGVNPGETMRLCRLNPDGVTQLVLRLLVPPVPGLECWWVTTKQGLTPLLVLCRPFGADFCGRDESHPYNALFQFLKNLTHLCLQFFYLFLLRVFLALQGGYYLLLLFDGLDEHWGKVGVLN